jgi:non-ribosomal peptide synthetase-like protein
MTTLRDEGDAWTSSRRQFVIGDDASRLEPLHERLDELFEELTTRYGSTPAVFVGSSTWTYADINERANRFANLLLEEGVRPGDRVGLLLNRSPDTYVAMLAVSKARATYVPLAPAFPDQRLQYICGDAGLRLVISVGLYREKAERLLVPNLLIDDLAVAVRIDQFPSAPLPPTNAGSVTTDNICYILYTSGTTGQPKGVVIEHRSLCNFIRVAAQSYGYRSDDRIYQGMTIAFDFSVEEIWVPFMAGAAIVPAPGEQALMGEELADFLRENDVTCMACSPTLLSSVESYVPELRLILVGGEACPPNLVARWSRTGLTILNTYGPTEATVTATMCLLDPEKPVTIGKPLPSYSIAILHPSKPELAALGEIGEIGIAGIGLAAGYLNRPELTDEKFIGDFFGFPNNPSRRIYRTGDLGFLNEDGEIEYHGRVDTQVKIRGNRIELGEIETALLEMDAIGQAVATTWEPEPERQELVAYYTVISGTTPPSHGEITRNLKQQLPDFMVPNDLVELAAIPMTVSDKVDVRRLPRPTTSDLATVGPIVEPGNESERFVVDALCEALKREKVSVDAHFFDDLGANSLLMARLCARLRKNNGWGTACMRDIYLHPTAMQLAAHMQRQAEAVEPLVETQLSSQASDFAYRLCGTAQLAFYALYGFVILWCIEKGLNWINEELDSPVGLYFRSTVLAVVVFVGWSAIPVVAKWLIIGRWKAETFPIWGLKYFRFWVVMTLIRSAPVVLFKGSPLYSLYLTFLGAHLGENTVIECKSVPVCTDLITIGDNTILRKDSTILGYRAEAGYIHTGPVRIGRNAFIGEASILDIHTGVGDSAQLGHSSSLQSGQSIPEGERWHGSPAIQTTADYCNIADLPCSKARRIFYEAFQIFSLLAIAVPLPLLMLSYWQWTSDDLDETIGQLAVATTVILFGGLLLRLAGAVVIPRLFRPFLQARSTRSIYSLHYWLQSVVSASSNSRLLNLVFGDSSAVVHYIRAVGWNLNTVHQTGSNFGTNQQHDNPLFCEIGSGTMVSDGLSMINMHKSATSFRLEHTKVGENSYLGNNIYFPPDAKVGPNCLLGTKVMVPIEGLMRENVGLLGSPVFEVPRMVDRDKELLNAVDANQQRRRLARKNVHNLVTVALFFASHWLVLFVTLVLWDRALNYYSEWGAWAFFAAWAISIVFLVLFYSLIECASLGFRRLKSEMVTIYDPYFWFHERHWKLSDTPIVNFFAGTPFRPMVLRLLKVKIGRRVFDGGCTITERSLVEIGNDATLNEGCVLQPHSLEEGAFKSDEIKVGEGSTLGPSAFIHYGVVVGRCATVDADAFVMKGERIEPNTGWRANPAKLHRTFVGSTETFSHSGEQEVSGRLIGTPTAERRRDYA